MADRLLVHPASKFIFNTGKSLSIVTSGKAEDFAKDMLVVSCAAAFGEGEVLVLLCRDQ